MFALSVDNVLEYEDNREIVAGVDREVELFAVFTCLFCHQRKRANNEQSEHYKNILFSTKIFRHE